MAADGTFTCEDIVVFDRTSQFASSYKVFVRGTESACGYGPSGKHLGGTKSAMTPDVVSHEF